jgi:hypothetical protein
MMYFELDKKGNLLKTGASLKPHHILPITPAMEQVPRPILPHQTAPPPSAPIDNDELSDDPWIIRDDMAFEQDFNGYIDFL